jgi:hypothetical protein
MFVFALCRLWFRPRACRKGILLTGQACSRGTRLPGRARRSEEWRVCLAARASQMPRESVGGEDDRNPFTHQARGYRDFGTAGFVASRSNV